MDIGIKIFGLKEVETTFRNLPPAMQNKATRPALRKGATVLRNAVSENIQAVTSEKASGKLSKSIRVYGLKPRQGNLRVAVRVKKGAVSAKGVRYGLIAGVLEYGSPGGKRPPQPPRPAWRKAAREKVGPVFNAFADEYDKRKAAAVDAAKAGRK